MKGKNRQTLTQRYETKSFLSYLSVRKASAIILSGTLHPRQ